MNQNEIEMVQRARLGDLDALEQLWKLYYQELYQQICLTIRNSKEARNLLLSTFVTAGENLNKLSQPSAFRVWIHWIARRQCRQFFDNHEYAFEQEEETLPYVSIAMQNSELSIPTVYGEEEEKEKVLGKIIASLNDMQREAVSLYYFAGLSADETAGVLEIQLNELKTRLYMARCEIRDALEAHEAENGEKLMGNGEAEMTELPEIFRVIGESMELSESTAAPIWKQLVSILRGETKVEDEEEEEFENDEKNSGRKERRERKQKEPREPKERKPLKLPELSEKGKRLALFIGIPVLIALIIGAVLLIRGGFDKPVVENSGAEQSSSISSTPEETGDPNKLSESDAQDYYASTLSKLDTDLAYDGVIRYASRILSGSTIPDFYQIRGLQEAYNHVTGSNLSLVMTVDEDGYPSELSGSEQKNLEKKASLLDEERGYAYCRLQDLQTILDYFYGPGTINTQEWAKKTDGSNNQMPYIASGYLFYADAIEIEPDGALYYSLFGIASDSQTPSVTLKALRRDNYLTLKDAAGGHSYYNAELDSDPSDSRLYSYYLKNGNEGNIYTALTREFEINDYFLNTIEIGLKKENGKVYITGVDYPMRGDYYVNTDWLRVRSEPSTEGDILGYCNQGEYLTILTRENGEDGSSWGKITFEAQEGYVSMDYVEKWSAGYELEEEKGRWEQLQASIERRKEVRRSGDRFENRNGDISSKPDVKPESSSQSEVPESFPETIEVLEGGWYQVNTESGMNVRQGPSSDYELVGTLNAEDTVEIYEILTTNNGEWGRVTSKEGPIGYVSMAYMVKAE